MGVRTRSACADRLAGVRISGFQRVQPCAWMRRRTRGDRSAAGISAEIDVALSRRCASFVDGRREPRWSLASNMIATNNVTTDEDRVLLHLHRARQDLDREVSTARHTRRVPRLSSARTWHLVQLGRSCGVRAPVRASARVARSGERLGGSARARRRSRTGVALLGTPALHRNQLVPPPTRGLMERQHLGHQVDELE